MTGCKKNLPPPHSGQFEGSFAYLTIKDRLPAILVRIIDTLCRKKDEIRATYGEQGLPDLKVVAGRLAKLRNEVMTDKAIQPVTDKREDAPIWNAFLEELKQADPETKPSWYTAPWLYVECYMYRRMHEAFLLSCCLRKMDVFMWPKREAYQSSLASIKTLAHFTYTTVGQMDTAGDLDTLFQHFMHIDLWGNKCDLSISAGVNSQKSHSPMEQVTALQSHILVDDSVAIHHCLKKAKRKGKVNLHVVLDNAGYELFTDFCLMEFLMQAGIVDSVHFHGKPHPWFISDVLRDDIDWMVDELAQSGDKTLMNLGKKWRGYFDDKSWTYSAHQFWCLHMDYSMMIKYAPELYSELSAADLIIIKGDLNYRKLTGDLIWDVTTPFVVALRGFAPAPLCVLRTLKADVLVGLKPKQEQETTKKDENWRVNGDWAVIQYSNMVSEVDFFD